MAREYSEEELIEELKRVSEEHCDGETPKMIYMDVYGKYSSSIYRSRFGTWNEALEKAGLEKDLSRHGRRYTEGELKEELVRISREYCDGESPSQQEIDMYSDIAQSTYYKRFGSHNSALKEAGLDTNSPVKEKVYSDEELIDEIKRISREYCEGESPTKREMKKYSDISQNTYYRYFGSHNSALKEAGMDVNENGIGTKIPKQELIDEIKRISKFDSTYNPPSSHDIKKHSNYTFGCFIRRFGSWVNTLEEAGYEAIDRSSGKNHPNWKGGEYEEEYGSSWESNRKEARVRDGRRCRVCSSKTNGENPDTHHITPKRYWNVEQEHEKMNHPRNLICLCRSCHNELEGKFKGRSHEEFEEMAKEYLGIEEEEPVDTGVKQSIFNY